jgi:hypothetical protein
MDVPTPPVLDAADLARRLRETEAELARVTLRLRRLEDSTSVQVARLLRGVAKNPRKGLADLPHAAARIARRRRGRRGRPDSSSPTVRERGPATRGTGTPRAATPAEPAAQRLPDRLLAASAVLVTTRDRPVLAVVADEASRQRWGDDAHVQPLRPDDALAVLATVLPDVLVVDAAAGRDGPWSGLGTYEVPERDRTVLDLLRAARDRGVPAVLVRGSGPEEAPMLADARNLFSAEVAPDAAIADLVAAGRGAA